MICGLARANFKDIDRCWEAVRHASARASTPSSAPRRCTAPSRTSTWTRWPSGIHDTVTHARNLCDNVQWSPMDATRTEHDYLCRVVEIAIKAGATTINIPDTVGYTAPRESAALIRHAAGARAGRRRRSSSPPTATTTSAWRRPTRSRRSRPARGRSNARSTAWASGPATPRWKRS